MSTRALFSRCNWDWSNVTFNDFERLTLPQKRGKVLELFIHNFFRGHGREIWKGYLDYYDLDNRAARKKFEKRSGTKISTQGPNAVGLDGIVELENDYVAIQIKYRKRQRSFDTRTFYQEINRLQQTSPKKLHPCLVTNSIFMDEGDYSMIKGSHLLFWCEQFDIKWPEILEHYPNNPVDPLEIAALRKFFVANS